MLTVDAGLTHASLWTLAAGVDRQRGGPWLTSEPVDDRDQPTRQHQDIESILRRPVIDCVFLGRQQIDERRRERSWLEHARQVQVARL